MSALGFGKVNKMLPRNYLKSLSLASINTILISVVASKYGHTVSFLELAGIETFGLIGFLIVHAIIDLKEKR